VARTGATVPGVTSEREPAVQFILEPAAADRDRVRARQPALPPARSHRGHRGPGQRRGDHFINAGITFVAIGIGVLVGNAIVLLVRSHRGFTRIE
jgi:hypothetical protein